MEMQEILKAFSLLGTKEVQAALAQAEKAVTPANFNTAQKVYQPGGLFAAVGLETDVLSTHVTPRGISKDIPAYPSMLTDPRYPIFTGWSDLIGSRPNGVCDAGPTSYMKGGTLTAQFGRVQHDTETIETSAILQQARGVNSNLHLIGDVMGDTNFVPDFANKGKLFDSVIAAQMIGVGVQFERDLSKLVWQGTPANNTAGGGHKEFPGLDAQIATGQLDAETGVALAAADSYIVDWNFAAVDSTTKDIVTEILSMEYYLFHLAERTGMNPVQHKVVMRPELWYELSAIWPCRYNTNRCSSTSSSNIVTINDNYQVLQRDNMRRSMTIEINGRTYPVETDDGIYEYNNQNSASVAAGNFASALYFVPIRVRGNFPVLFWEYIDYTQFNSEVSLLGAGARNVEFWTDSGRFQWAMFSNGFCFKLAAKSEMRLVLRAPQLAGKISKIRYTPTKHLASPYPDSPYYRSGGASMTSIPARGQAVWR